jgi:phage terminase Nu1 subunit (DNA packaging protein)
MRQPEKNAKLLNSWKEIASYLGRGVRTVQRWEESLHLPVRRVGESDRSPVFAFSNELDFWLYSRGAHLESDPAVPKQREQRLGDAAHPRVQLQRSVDLSRELLSRASRHLAETERLLGNLQQLRFVTSQYRNRSRGTPDDTLEIEMEHAREAVAKAEKTSAKLARAS